MLKIKDDREKGVEVTLVESGEQSQLEQWENEKDNRLVIFWDREVTT